MGKHGHPMACCNTCRWRRGVELVEKKRFSVTAIASPYWEFLRTVRCEARAWIADNFVERLAVVEVAKFELTVMLPDVLVSLRYVEVRMVRVCIETQSTISVCDFHQKVSLNGIRTARSAVILYSEVLLKQRHVKQLALPENRVARGGCGIRVFERAITQLGLRSSFWG